MPDSAVKTCQMHVCVCIYSWSLSFPCSPECGAAAPLHETGEGKGGSD